MLLISIDLGTTGVRVEAYSSEGSMKAYGSARIKAQDTVGWIDALKEAMPNVRESTEEKAVVVDSTSGSFIVVDRYGEPLLPPSMYYEKAVEEYDEIGSKPSAIEIGRRGIAISATSPLPRIVRLMKREPGKFRIARWILPPTTWLTYRLIIPEGSVWEDLEIDHTNALKFGEDITVDPPCWFEPLFDEAGVGLDLMPRIVGCGDYAGVARSRLADELGLYGAKVYHGMTDGNASALASGCISPGDFSIGCGSTTVPKYVTRTMRIHPALYYHKHPVEGYLAGAAPVTGGFVDWFIEKILGLDVGEAYRLAELSDAGSEYLFFPQGDRSPFDDPKLAASILGLWPTSEAREVVVGRIVRSMLVSIAFLEYFYIDLMEKLFDSTISEVRITGGGSRSGFWNRIRASVYEKRVRVMEEKVCVGALIPVVLKVGLCETSEEAMKRFLRVVGIVDPDPMLTGVYRAGRDRFYELWVKLKDLYDHI
ncbi:MAG: FGGY-family carbohydrate kinase [Candidatus Bathyarchaeia archaeon]